MSDTAEKVALCVTCRNSFTAVELEDAIRKGACGCPNCGSESVPADPRKTHTLTLTDHEWRILFIWAGNWEASMPPAEQKGVIQAIAYEARRQQPTLPSLSLYRDIQEASTATGLTMEVHDPSGETTVVTPQTRH